MSGWGFTAPAAGTPSPFGTAPPTKSPFGGTPASTTSFGFGATPAAKPDSTKTFNDVFDKSAQEKKDGAAVTGSGKVEEEKKQEAKLGSSAEAEKQPVKQPDGSAFSGAFQGLALDFKTPPASTTGIDTKAKVVEKAAASTSAPTTSFGFAAPDSKPLAATPAAGTDTKVKTVEKPAGSAVPPTASKFQVAPTTTTPPAAVEGPDIADKPPLTAAKAKAAGAVVPVQQRPTGSELSNAALIAEVRREMEADRIALQEARAELEKQPKTLPIERSVSDLPKLYNPILDIVPQLAKSTQQLRQLCEEAMCLRYETELQRQVPDMLRTKLRNYREVHATSLLASGQQGPLAQAHRWQELVRKAQLPTSTPSEVQIAVDSMWSHAIELDSQASKTTTKPELIRPSLAIGYRPRPKIEVPEPPKAIEPPPVDIAKSKASTAKPSSVPAKSASAVATSKVRETLVMEPNPLPVKGTGFSQDKSAAVTESIDRGEVEELIDAAEDSKTKEKEVPKIPAFGGLSGGFGVKPTDGKASETSMFGAIKPTTATAPGTDAAKESAAGLPFPKPAAGSPFGAPSQPAAATKPTPAASTPFGTAGTTTPFAAAATGATTGASAPGAFPAFGTTPSSTSPQKPAGASESASKAPVASATAVVAPPAATAAKENSSSEKAPPIPAFGFQSGGSATSGGFGFPTKSSAATPTPAAPSASIDKAPDPNPTPAKPADPFTTSQLPANPFAPKAPAPTADSTVSNASVIPVANPATTQDSNKPLTASTEPPAKSVTLEVGAGNPFGGAVTTISLNPAPPKPPTPPPAPAAPPANPEVQAAAPSAAENPTHNTQGTAVLPTTSSSSTPAPTATSDSGPARTSDPEPQSNQAQVTPASSGPAIPIPGKPSEVVTNPTAAEVQSTAAPVPPTATQSDKPADATTKDSPNVSQPIVPTVPQPVVTGVGNPSNAASGVPPAQTAATLPLPTSATSPPTGSAFGVTPKPGSPAPAAVVTGGGLDGGKTPQPNTTVPIFPVPTKATEAPPQPPILPTATNGTPVKVPPPITAGETAGAKQNPAPAPTAFGAGGTTNNQTPFVKPATNPFGTQPQQQTFPTSNATQPQAGFSTPPPQATTGAAPTGATPAAFPPPPPASSPFVKVGVQTPGAFPSPATGQTGAAFPAPPPQPVNAPAAPAIPAPNTASPAPQGATASGPFAPAASPFAKGAPTQGGSFPSAFAQTPGAWPQAPAAGFQKSTAPAFGPQPGAPNPPTFGAPKTQLPSPAFGAQQSSTFGNSSASLSGLGAAAPATGAFGKQPSPFGANTQPQFVSGFKAA